MPLATRLTPLLLFLAAGSLHAQQPITLDVVVTPAAGRDRAPVAGLSASDLILLNNGIPQPITSFRPAPGPMSEAQLVILLDAVNVPFTVIADERQQVGRFLRGNSGSLPLPTTLGVVTDTGLRPLTSEGHGAASRDGNALAAALEQDDISLRTIRRSAGVYGAEDRLGISLNALRTLALQERARPGRKIVIWVSPGWPVLSGPGIELSGRQQQSIFGDILSISALLRDARITISSIDPIGAAESVLRGTYYETFLKPIEKPSQVDLGDLALQVLAVQSGGLALHGNNDIAAQLREAVADTGAFYELTFTPPPAEHPAAYHRLEVKVEKPGLVARTRTGYYDPAPAADAPPK